MTNIWIILIVSCLLPAISLGVVTITNNGYRGIEVVIHEDVAEDLNLLQKVKVNTFPSSKQSHFKNVLLHTLATKDMLTTSSSWLYNTTKRRAYFQDITIILPSTWSSRPEYKKVPQDDYYDTATLRIGPPHPGYNHTPYTLQPGGCGEFGKYIHMTPDYITNYKDPVPGTLARQFGITNFSGLARIFVHEWYHFRYGVFNEYSTNDPRFPPFYKDNDKYYPNVCPVQVKGYVISPPTPKGTKCFMDRTGKLNKNCTFSPALNSIYSASIMFMPQLPQATGPCEDDYRNGRFHNIHAPNEQNLKCNRRSMRNVMNSGPDFRNGRNPPRDIHQTDPTITILHIGKDTFPGYVLVLDASSSMKGERWEQLKEAASRAIKYKVKSSCPLGIVSFSDDAQILAQLTPINDTTRHYLLTRIPEIVGGYTSIGKSLQAALEVLGNDNKTVEKGKIILITDGEENQGPFIANVTKPLQDANVIVYGLAFGANASKRVEELSYVTGGKGWSFNSAHFTQSLDSMLDEIFQNCGPVKDRPVININGAFKLPAGDNRTAIFHVDIGTSTMSLFISYDYPDKTIKDSKIPLVTITSPSGEQYTSQSAEYSADSQLKTVMFKIRNAEPGKWTYHFKNQDNNDIHLNLMITSQKGNTSDDPIRVTSWLTGVNLTYPQVPKIYVEVKKNMNPILNATVTARVMKPNGDSVKVPLQDNGIGADATANDGIYSEYYTYYNGNGRYAIHSTVDSNNQTGIAPNLPPYQLGAPDFPYLLEDVAKTEPQSEFQATDFEQVDEEFQTSSGYDSITADRHPSHVITEKTGHFERFTTAGTFILTEWQPKDLIQPGWISDLKVNVNDKENRTVTLEWTSAGDDMYTGNASFIEVRFHPDVRQLLQSFNSTFNNFTILKGSLQPSEPYQVHTLHLQLPSEDQLSLTNTSQVIYFALRTLDEERNCGEVSNPVQANFKTNSLPLDRSSCEKFVHHLIKCKETPPRILERAFHTRKTTSEIYNMIIRYDTTCSSSVEMHDVTSNIPKHCWQEIDTALENLRNKLAYISVIDDHHQEIQSVNTNSKTTWRKWKTF